MLKIYLIILLIAIIFISTPLYSQIHAGTISEQIEHWQGKNSNDIIDYILKLKPFTVEKFNDNKFCLVIRTEIYGRKPVEYQITLRQEKNGENKLMLIFEHPISKSIQKQYEELMEKKPEISLEEAATQIKIRRDTVFIDSTFQYYNLINEMYKLEFSVLYYKGILLDGTYSQVYMHNDTNEYYNLLPFGDIEYKFSNWIERLFMAMIDHFYAIDPYPNNK
ncbi:MAG: hypothetical protein JXA06_06535 [Bacteroidetes bacterium]|nr:hypothetical protein [Bacteroidota bacterium]